VVGDALEKLLQRLTYKKHFVQAATYQPQDLQRHLGFTAAPSQTIQNSMGFVAHFILPLQMMISTNWLDSIKNAIHAQVSATYKVSSYKTSYGFSDIA
jgi:hypothetical protein